MHTRYYYLAHIHVHGGLTCMLYNHGVFAASSQAFLNKSASRYASMQGPFLFFRGCDYSHVKRNKYMLPTKKTLVGFLLYTYRIVARQGEGTMAHTLDTSAGGSYTGSVFSGSLFINTPGSYSASPVSPLYIYHPCDVGVQCVTWKATGVQRKNSNQTAVVPVSKSLVLLKASTNIF